MKKRTLANFQTCISVPLIGISPLASRGSIVCEVSQTSLLEKLISCLSESKNSSKSNLTNMNCFCGMFDRQKAFTSYFQPGLLSEILTVANLRLPASRVWTCAESEFRLFWTKLCSSDNHYTTEPTWRLSLHYQWKNHIRYSFFYMNSFVRTKALVLAKNLRTS